ncbi:MAG: adenylosuccinate synthase [Microscillaceae bacterium]|jgi:adenylosuccinate synthase|nr:adenylosuccinate synthase [Microscillaceae bacterium]
MKVNVLLGLQWGDEGKGKIVDYLAPQYQVVARFQGGPNAGHTLEFDGHKHVLQQIPSGIFRTQVKNIIGNGLVINPVVFKKEVESLLAKFAIDLNQNLFISKKAHLIIPTHKVLDAALEQLKGDKKIGSTLHGIGPAYQNKVGRLGLRIGDILRPNFQEKYQELVYQHQQLLANLNYDYDLATVEVGFWEAIEFLKKMNLTDTEYLINDCIQSQQSILAEGAQGSLLDIDFGSYPYVTSSNTITAGALTGLGIAPKHIGEVLGIFKAYCTRVGGGPFPTEQENEIGEKLREVGREFGAVTGRKRRCGWLDLPALKYTAMLNGVTQLLMMKVDVLNDFEEIQVCTHYELPDGEVTDRLPYCLNDVPVKPIYRKFKGWNASLAQIQTFEDLPRELRDYIAFIEAELQIPITLVSTGPDRIETIIKGLKN